MKNEGKLTTEVEYRTRKVPSVTLLLAAAGSVLLSFSLMAAGKRRASLFVGQWAPTILAFATYNKLVKTFSAPYSESQRIKHGDHAARPELKYHGDRLEPQPTA